MSRPTAYNKEIALDIYLQLTSGETLREISAYKDMPCLATIYNWRKKYPEFAKNCDLAKRVRDGYKRHIEDIRWH